MARGDGQPWEEDELLYSSRDSDDSPILSYRHDKYRRYSSPVREEKAEERDRRSTFSVLAKFFLFCTAMILFCMLLYIPVFYKANDEVFKPTVAGWSMHTNRDTKIYIQPENVTTIHEPKDVCPKSSRKEKNKLFILIIVYSSTTNFKERITIRETWGNYKNYLILSKLFHAAKEKYKNYNSSIEMDATDDSNVSINLDRTQRDIAGFNQLLPELVKAVQSNVAKATDAAEEKRFEDEKDDDKMLPEFDMNRVLGDDDDTNFYDEYGSNVMEIGRRDYEKTPDLDKFFSLLKHDKTFPKLVPDIDKDSKSEPDFKLVFLVGQPPVNKTEVQQKIDAEVETYGDIIQESFLDTYNNLTLKTIMMLKWATNNCNESVRYIVKSDDDTFINVPNLVSSLRARAKKFDDSAKNTKENLLMGVLICNAKPVQDTTSKWYSPHYMYAGRVYPRYLSGVSYAVSSPAARALYEAALITPFFHLEDVYITGMCALRANPRVVPSDEPGFSMEPVRKPCEAYTRISGHRVPLAHTRAICRSLLQPTVVERCERNRLAQVKRGSSGAATRSPTNKKHRRFSRTQRKCK